MHINDFNYNLPDQSIAQHPPAVRGSSRLLTLNRDTGAVEHSLYRNLPDFVSPGDLVILNNTLVIRARLVATSSTGKNHEFLLLERHAKKIDTHHWKVLYRGKVRAGEVYHVDTTALTVDSIVGNGIAVISCSEDLLEVSNRSGSVPLPPYMKREATEDDIKRYQTEFAKEPGSVAAPTASLNFTNEIRDALLAKGSQIAYLTLHVGLGTFLPIRVDDVKKHKMHSEFYEIPRQTVEAIRQTRSNGKRVIAVGTTVARTLEYAASEIATDGSDIHALSGEADIFIYPGYQFKVVDALVTNFHAPKSTVLMLTAAFSGWPNLKHAYEVAIENDYKLLSYGDSMLIK